jgi:hypothetical protein
LRLELLKIDYINRLFALKLMGSVYKNLTGAIIEPTEKSAFVSILLKGKVFVR